MNHSPWKICIAPMLNWTNRHYRYFMRQITRHTRLYTEMISANAIIYGDIHQHLDFDPIEQPVALQIAGSSPQLLARCAFLVQQWGYSEINLNLGCPSYHAQQGKFGACLMKDIPQIITCVHGIQKACKIPLSIKHRIGIDEIEAYDFVASFVEKLFSEGCKTFIVHARSASLKASPKKNRTAPPLRYEYVYQLKKDYPKAHIILNGGIETIEEIQSHLQKIDGVMIGREAYNNPYFFEKIDELFWSDEPINKNRIMVAHKMLSYIEKTLASNPNLNPHAMTQSMIHLFHGQKGSKIWRQMLSIPYKNAEGAKAFEKTLSIMEKLC